jgi:hypothetical protein
MDENGRAGYLVFRWSPAGYTLEERSGDLPKEGAEIEDGEGRFRVTKLAPSPLPGDRRRCVYLLPELVAQDRNPQARIPVAQDP